MTRGWGKGFVWDAGAAILVVLLPLLVFLKHHDYPLATPEIGILLGLSCLAGIFWGILMILGGPATRLVVTVFLAVMVVDIQTTWITTLGLRLVLNVLFFGTLFWFLRRRLSPVVLVVAGAMVLGTLVSPGREQVRPRGAAWDQAEVDADLPFVLHLVLDEHIGIEGIPRQFDPDRQVADLVRNSYVDRGFRVFGRAYSSYYVTLMSMPNLMNFSSSTDPEAFLSPAGNKRWSLDQNAWFDYLSDMDYWIHVIQPEYLTYDQGMTSPEIHGVSSSVTFAAESISALAPVNMPAPAKARFILGSYMRLSYFLGLMRNGYGQLRRSGLGQDLGLPPWDLSGKNLSTLSSMNAVQIMKRDLEFAGPGRAFFVHLLLPHFPYAFERDCRIREVEDAWLNVRNEALAPRRNDPASRALRYPQYLDQLVCTHHTVQGILDDLSQRPWWDEAIVVIHGDHGSRLDLVPPFVSFQKEFTAAGLIDGFSTLFVLKKPGVPAGYDRRQLPVGHLFKRLVKEGTDLGDQDLESRPRVMISDENRPLLEVDLPIFDHGQPLATAADRR